MLRVLLGPPDDPSLLFLPVDALPPDLLRGSGQIAAQPAGVTPGLQVLPAAPPPHVDAPPSPYAWPGGPPVQGDNLLNSQATSQVNAPITITLQGTAGARVHLYSIVCRCSPAGTSTILIADGPTQLYPAGLLTFGAAITSFQWGTGLTIRETNSCTITFAAAGAGNQVLAFVQADRF